MANVTFRDIDEENPNLGLLVQEQQEKRTLRDAVKRAIITAVMSGKMKTKQGTDLSALGDLDLEGAGFGRTLGRLGGAFEPVTNKSKFSYSTARRALGDLAMTPEELYLEGLATGTPGTEVLGRKRAGGIFGYGPGSRIETPPVMIGAEGAQKPQFSKYQVRPEAQNLLNAAKEMLGGEISLEEESTGEITLPEEITTTSEAVDYLMTNHNMTKEEAIEWIRQNAS